MRPVFLLTLLIPAAAYADYNSIDAQGCWDGLTPHHTPCLSLVSTRTTSGGEFIAKWTNTCPQRIEVEMCNQKTDGKWDCGMDSIRPDETRSWGTYHATGTYSGVAIGATKPDQDWVCSDRYKGWKKH